MPSSSSARMTRTAISPRLATRTFANMRREDYLVADAVSRSVADRAVALRARALQRDRVGARAAPPADPRMGGRLHAVLGAAGPGPRSEDLREPVVIGRGAPLHRGDVGPGAGAKRMPVPHGAPRYPECRCANHCDEFAQVPPGRCVGGCAPHSPAPTRPPNEQDFSTDRQGYRTRSGGGGGVWAPPPPPPPPPRPPPPPPRPHPGGAAGPGGAA